MDAPDPAEAWLGPVGSLGPHRKDSTKPKSDFSQEVSKALTSSLRHGDGPKTNLTPAGYAELPDILRLPRLRKLQVTAGDLRRSFEILRKNDSNSRKAAKDIPASESVYYVLPGTKQASGKLSLSSILNPRPYVDGPQKP